MTDAIILLTPIHYIYLAGVVLILTTMILRKDTPVVCIAFLFLIGTAGLGSLSGGIQTIFNSILYAAIQFMEIIATIALITAFSKCLRELRSDALLMAPMAKIMGTPCKAWWALGITMLVFSLFLWPSPSVALIGAIILPLALKAGLTPLAAAMAMNIFGHGIALSYDFIIQGAPAVSAGAAGISTSDILTQGRPLFWIMGTAVVLSAFFINKKSMTDRVCLLSKHETNEKSTFVCSRPAVILAILTPLAFIADIFFMVFLGLKGTDATSLVSGTAVLLMCIGTLLEFKTASLEKVTEYLTDGFLFAIRIFAPVIVIGAFFFLGSDGITNIMGDSFKSGILNDWALWLAHHAPVNKYVTALIQLIIGGLTGLDGSGFSGLPLTGALADTFGTATGASVPVLASLGQISAIFIGGGTIVPWGLIPVAAICNVSPVELARKNMAPVFIGFLCTFAAACFLL